LTNFVKDYSDFDPREASSGHQLVSTSLDSNAEKPMSLDGVKVTDDGVVASPSSSSSRTEQTSPPFFNSPVPGSTEPSSIDFNLSFSMSSPEEEKPLEDVQREGQEGMNPLENDMSQVSLADSIPVSDRISSIFARASVLLRDSMDLDGVTFLDAARSNPSL
jgi:hypothetical protein